MNFASIVIAGGAMKVVSTIGCVKYLEEHNAMSHIKNYVGTSAGAIMCFFLVLGYKSYDIETFLLNNLYDEAISKFDASQIFNILTSYGLSDGQNIVELFERILFKKMKVRDITFMELTKSLGKNLVICASNLTDEREEFFCVDTHPNLSVITALRASCSIPFLFHPVTLDDKIFIDGALYNNFPIDHFQDHTLKDIIGLNVVQTNYQNTSDIISFSLFMIFSMINKMQKTKYDSADRNIVTIDIEDTDWFSLENLQLTFPPEMIKTYINTGYMLIKERLDKLDHIVE